MDQLAKIISSVSNPLVISAPISFSLVFKSSQDFYYAVIWTLISMLFSFVVGLFVFFGVKKGIFSDLDISKRQERFPVFVFTIVISFIYLAVIFLLNGPRVLLLALGAVILGVFLDSFINRKIKASIHLAAYSSFSLIVGILYGGIFWIMLLLAPIVAWSRIKLKKHVLAETVIGTILGMLLVVILYFCIKYYYYVK